MNDTPRSTSRRWFVKAGAVASSALALGAPGSAAAQETETDGDAGPSWTTGRMPGDEFYPGTVFRAASPALEEPPESGDSEAVADWGTHVIEYFNTNEEAYLYVPPDEELDDGELYRFDDDHVRTEGDSDMRDVRYRPLDTEEIQFDLEEGEAFDIVAEGGGEAAVRPRNFSTNTLFRITSGIQGWAPDDVEESGYFTDYNTHHATYLGTDEEFLFFPQEDADYEEDTLYVMWDEFEFLDPVGNLVAVEFEPVDEESLTVDDEFL